MTCLWSCFFFKCFSLSGSSVLVRATDINGTIIPQATISKRTTCYKYLHDKQCQTYRANTSPLSTHPIMLPR